MTVCTIGSSGAEARNVAEQTFALLLALAKRLVPAHNALVEADWALPRLQRSLTELSGKTLGIVGLDGQIGREVARRAEAFDMTVVYGKAQGGVEAEERLGGALHVPLEELLRTADYITLHAPLTGRTPASAGRRTPRPAEADGVRGEHGPRRADRPGRARGTRWSGVPWPGRGSTSSTRNRPPPALRPPQGPERRPLTPCRRRDP
ncbi:Formate dehydrogenase, mitochondrial [Streptomyces glaucescens]